jgi:hypothetical protein
MPIQIPSSDSWQYQRAGAGHVQQTKDEYSDGMRPWIFARPFIVVTRRARHSHTPL